MIDISNKTKTLRTAVAKGTLKLKQETIDLIRQNKIPKGDPLAVAKVATIQAAKNTSQIVPYCHPLPVDYVGVEFSIGEGFIEVSVTVKAIYKTGVEMEALTAASVAVLTIYDMTKMLDDSMEIVGVKLLEKTGGKSDFKTKYDKPLRAAVLVMSDSVYAGKKSDLSGKLIVDRLKKELVEVVDYKIIPDELEQIASELIRYADELKLDLVVTTGGTGFSPRDCTPEAMRRVIEREVPGIPEAARSFGQERTPYSMLSRASAGLRGNTLIVNLPGSKKGVAESLDALFPGLLHSFRMISGGGH
ncbi:MAG: bifunctional molybdenum cofactor biosynthesis protein MoaC/MoaB [Bacteroidota bacterium]|nr:bifunctional molybdenum cofactor biosynthesis protein MoaC/MoaB [Bacteroidota bacterium]